jgi:tRNA(fMet)-specific endonuclease VapC
MNGRYLLDTNIVIAIFAQDASVTFQLASATEVLIPSIVIGELFYGAYNSKRIVENVQRINDFIEANTIISCDSETAKCYGQIKNILKTKGRPIPENDIWIAAIAQQHQLTLVSRDGHLNEVDSIELEVW